jgi:hypothetical protein
MSRKLKTKLTHNGTAYYVGCEMKPADIDPMEKLLRRHTAVPDTDECDVLRTLSFNFGHRMEADIKVCNGDTGPWVDAVLFNKGCEVAVLEPSDSLAGEYPFEWNGHTYTVEIVRVP